MLTTIAYSIIKNTTERSTKHYKSEYTNEYLQPDRLGFQLRLSRCAVRIQGLLVTDIPSRDEIVAKLVISYGASSSIYENPCSFISFSFE